MASHDDVRPGGPEQGDVVRFGPARPRRRPPRWIPVAASVLVGAGVAAGIAAGVAMTIAHRTKPTATAPATAAASGTAKAPAPAGAAPIVVTRLGRPLLGVRAGWDLFALGQTDSALGQTDSALGGEALVRIQPARGLITRTVIPPLLSSGPVSFLAGPHQVIIRPLDLVPGYLVPDGQPARGLHAALSHGGMVFPGPRPGQLWSQGARGLPALMSLIDPAGRKLGPVIRVPAGGYWPAAPDGSGYLLIHWRGAVYDARPGGRRRVTTGMVAAVGPTRWLATDCGYRHCTDIVIDPATGARHVLARGLLARHRVGLTVPGAISPDGSTAALFLYGARGQITLHLVSLKTGISRGVPVNADRQSLNVSSMAWSPDSKWLFAVAAHGKLVAVRASTGRVRGLGAALPPVSQLAIRAG